MKYFREELLKFYEKLKNGKPFCLTKAADGEFALARGQTINNGEFSFVAGLHDFYKEKLIESLRYQHPDYYLGISTECCRGGEAIEMLEFVNQPTSQLTFANIFVNSNYNTYKELFLEEYKNHKVILVANENGRVDKLPFKVDEFYPVKNTAFIYNYDLIETIVEKDYKDCLFLFCAGPFGNMLGYELFKNNKKNIVLDIGSTLNPFLGSAGFERDYSQGGYYSTKTCTWFND